MAGKNKGFAEILTVAATSGLPPQVGVRAPEPILNARTNRLAEVASGRSISRTHQLVDPARCRMWSGHNRDYGALNYESCKELIESILSQRRQEMPAIVRRVQGEPDYDFEVICGARRHWAVTWLNAHNHRDIKFLIEPREMDDEEAFRIADLENRAREDLTDYERAKDYLVGLERYYEGQQKTMAARLKVSESWLSRYLDLARLPEPILKAFRSPHDVRLKHITQIKPLIRDSASREVVYGCVERIIALREKDSKYLTDAASVVRELKNAVDEAVAPSRRLHGTHRRRFAEIIRSSAGKALAQIDARTSKRMQVTFVLSEIESRQEMEEAMKLLLDRVWAE
jgi:ParB family chromosome partitioning protein